MTERGFRARTTLELPMLTEPEETPAPVEPEPVTDDLIMLLEQMEDYFRCPSDDE